jgi:hypothetical protein
VPGSKRTTFEQMSLLVTEISSVRLVIMRRVAASLRLCGGKAKPLISLSVC